MTNPTFGITFNRTSDEPRPVVPSDMAVLGIVLPSDDADATVFPLNTPVEFNSSDTAYLTKLGTGPLYRSVAAVNAQLDDYQQAARVVVSRVADDGNIDQVIANIVGSRAAGSGIFALLRAGEVLGVIPRVIGAPGYTGRFTRTDPNVNVTRAAKSGGNTGNGLMTLGGPSYGADAKNGLYRVRCIGGARSAASAPKVGGNTGTGAIGALTADATAATGAWRVICQAQSVDGGAFAVLRPDGGFDGVALVGTPYNSANGINFTLADAGVDFVVGDEFVVTVAAAVPANGGVFSVIDPLGTRLADAVVGTPYNGADIKFTIADGSVDFVIGDGFDVTVVITGGVAEANPICAALPAVCSALLAHAVVGGPATTKQDAIDWRETINSDRLIPVDCFVKAQHGTEVVEEDIVARAMGIAVRRDYLHGGVPSHSWANEPVQGIIGLKRYDTFSLTDGATDGQELLAANIGIVARGEMGVETAIAQSGFIFIATDNAGDDPLWQFYNVTRMRDYIHLGFLKALRKRLGASNITPHSVQALQNEMEFWLRDLKSDEHILGYRVGFEKDKNSPENLRLGRLRVFFQAEEPPVLRQLNIDSRRYRQALDDMLDTLIVQANTLVA
jgi:phage tail sheath protein FI